MYSWQNRKGVSAEGRSGESMLEIIRARAMPYFSHVLVFEKKKLPMLKEYIAAEIESDLMASDRKQTLPETRFFTRDYSLEIHARVYDE